MLTQQPSRRATVWLVSLALLSSVTGCRSTGLLFHKAEDLTILSPASNSVVQAPITMRWHTEHRPPTGTQFAVFVDRVPIGPGRTLRDAADRLCKREPDCPDNQYLNAHDIYVTEESSLVIDNLPDQHYRHGRVPGEHELSIVLLDVSGHRVGESVYSVVVRLDRG
jgi:hypothetical protein